MVIIAGPNGAGKTTASQSLLSGAYEVSEFVNADIIAKGLSVFHPERVAIKAGRMMLQQIDELAKAKTNFAFKTTLASRTFVNLIKEKRLEFNYECYLFYLWLPAPEISMARVRNRVILGGHHVPDSDIVRRYHGGLSNFFNLYMKIVDGWKFLDNSRKGQFHLIAEGSFDKKISIHDEELWMHLRKEYEQTTP